MSPSLSLLRSALPLALALSSCAYASDYRAPDDGRARVVWRDGEPHAIVPAKSGPCELATRDASSNAAPPDAVSRCVGNEACGYYQPPDPWFYVDVHHPHVPLAELHHHGGLPPHPGLPQPPIHPGDPVPGPVGGSHQALPANAPHSSGGGGGSSVGSSGLGDLKELAVVVAVVAILTMPAVAIALASARPESESLAAASVDEVNAYNDLARSPGSACSPIPPAPIAPRDSAFAPAPVYGPPPGVAPVPPAPAPSPDPALAPAPVPEAQP